MHLTPPTCNTALVLWVGSRFPSEKYLDFFSFAGLYASVKFSSTTLVEFTLPSAVSVSIPRLSTKLDETELVIRELLGDFLDDCPADKEKGGEG